jgi:FixJ family two-component response regulator
LAIIVCALGNEEEREQAGRNLKEWIFMIRPQTPIILCTGFSDTVDENKIKLMGIKELLLKPVSLRDLAGAVYKAVTQAKCARCDGINHTR